MKRHGLIALWTVWLMAGLGAIGQWSCSSSRGEEPVESDTTHIKKLANFLSDEERDSVARRAHFRDPRERLSGWPEWPQSGDDFRGRRMDTMFWDGLDLRNMDLRGVTMRSSVCTNDDFRGTDFRAADIRWTVFDGSDLRYCNFDQARLFHVKVNDALLDSSTFRGTNMFGMEGHGTMMRYCDFTGALMKDAEFVFANFFKSRGVKARLIRAVLKNSILDSTDFSYADFTGGGLDRASFRGAKLRHANFQGARLANADFSGADVYDVNFFGSRFNNTSFKGAKNIPPEIAAMMDQDSLVSGIWQELKKELKGR